MSDGFPSNFLADCIHELPVGERYLYQLFSLIEVGDLTVTNPEGNVFHLGQVDSDLPLHLIVHYAETLQCWADNFTTNRTTIAFTIPFLIFISFQAR